MSHSMTMWDILLPDLEATESFAQRIASILRAPDVIALGGELGAGKTTFSRALIRALDGSDIEVPSPTFTLVQIYELPTFELWHFDLYRLESPPDALELDIEDAFATSVSLVEWPERLGPYLPANRLDMRFSFAESPTVRQMSIQGGPEWACRLESILDD